MTNCHATLKNTMLSNLPKFKLKYKLVVSRQLSETDNVAYVLSSITHEIKTN